MPTFTIGDKVQGLNVPSAVVLNVPGTEANIVARLTGPVLFLPATETLTFKCKYEDASNHRTLILRFDSAAGLVFMEGQVALMSLEVRVRFSLGPGSLTPSLADSQSVTCVGTAEWRRLPPALGLNGQKLTFNVEYRHSGGGVGVFAFRLAQPIDVPVLYCRVLQAEISAEPLLSEGAIVVALSGSATLTQAAKTTAGQLLDPLFGTNAATRLTEPKFSYRQKFKLGQPVGTPSVGLSMDWNGAPPPLSNLPAGLSVDIKGPRFNVPLPDFNTPPIAFNVRFPECRLRFPQVTGMQAFELGGAFDLQRAAGTNSIKLSFLPTVTSGVDLPLVIRLFFSRLAWVGNALDGLANQAQLSLDEAEWIAMFQALLPSTGAINTGSFTTSLSQLINSALSNTSFGAERVFLLVFEAFSRRPDSAQLFGIVWSQWLSITTRATPAAIASLLRALTSLSLETFRTVLGSLFVVPNLNLTALLVALLPQTVDFASAEYLRLQRLVVQFIGGLVDVLDPVNVVTILINAWRTAPANMQTFTSLTDPRFAKLDLSFRAMTRLICEALSVLVLLADENLKLLRGLLPEIQLPSTERFIQHLLSPVTNLFDELERGLFPPWSKLLPMLKAMATYASGDRSREILLLEASRYPLAGIAITIGALLLALEKPTPWTSLLGQNIETLPGLKTKRLPPPFEHPTDPTKSIKYFILSDIHRDAVADDRGLFNFGSINHFSKNKDLYLEVLQRADEDGYTVIEAGDCEELWYIRDFNAFQGYPQLVSDIIAAHTPVFTKLRDMHKRGRYFRIQGNHDSFLREADVFAPLKNFMQTGNTVPFEIYDFILIADVKSMNDGVLDMVTEWPTAVSAASTARNFVSATLQHFASRTVGLDSRPYKGRKQLIIAHGHQWDFWNCDEHNLVGKMLSNMVGVTVDKLMDPFIDAEGISYIGNPVLDFRDVAAALYPADSWLSAAPALRATHTIQHMNDNHRLLNDNVSYCESLVALSAAFGMPLDKYVLRKNSAGDAILDSQGRPQYVKTTVASQTDPFKRFMEHYGHLICIGHTHAPHSMPYLPITSLAGPVIGDLINFLQSQIPIVSEIKVKSGYINSGTSGWFEGVVWGIEVHESGQPRLVYWTPGRRKPYRMDWELEPWDKAKRERFDQVLAGIVPNVEKYFDELVARFGGAAMEIAGGMFPVFSLPPELVPLLSNGNQPGPAINLDDGTAESPIERMQTVLMRVFAMFQRLANDPNVANGPHVFTMSVQVPPAVEARLVEFQAQITAGLNVTDPLRYAAGLVFGLANLERLTRGVRQFPDLSLDEESQLDHVWMLLLILMVIPNSPKFTTTIALANGTLTLTITLRR